MSADLREGGRWSIGQRAKNDVLFGLASVALAIARRAPRPALRAAGVALGVLAWALAPRARRLAEANVARGLPDLSPRGARALVRRTYRVLGRHLGDAVATLDPSRPLEPLPFEPGARERLDEAVREGRGVVFVSAHLGPWERVAATLVASGVKLTVVAREPYDPRLMPLYERLRGGRGVRAIYRGSKGAAAALLRTLRRAEVLGVVMDLASRVPSVEAPFLGVPAPTPVGPARLALRARAAVVVGTVAPRPDGSLAIATARIETGDLDGAPDPERLLVARINAVLSARIRALPDAWVWMHPRWPALTL